MAKVRERVKEEKVGGGVLVSVSFKEFPFLKDPLSNSVSASGNLRKWKP